MSYAPPPPPPAGGYPPPGGSPYGGTGRDYAEAGPRIVAGLIDYVGPIVLAYIILFALRSLLLGLLFILAAAAFGFYNAYLNGETGQSIGKKTQNIKVVSQETGQNIGGGMGIVRYLCHFLDGLICYFGYIYGLFIDKEKQTFADKIIKTVVVKA